MKKITYDCKCPACQGSGEETGMVGDKIVTIPCTACKGTKIIKKELFAENVVVEEFTPAPPAPPAPAVCELCHGSKKVTIEVATGVKEMDCPKCQK